MSKNMIDLNEVVKDWAWKEYEETATFKQKRLFKKQQKAKEKETHIGIQIDWSSVRFVDETTWNGDANVKTGWIVQAEPTTSVLFQTKFVNNTNDPHKYTMRTEKTTRSTINTSIEKGLTKGFEMGVKLTTPCELFEASAGFRREVTLSNSEGETFEEELTWGVDSEIQVNPNEVAEASLVVNEHKQAGKFVIETKMNGMVYVTFTNVKDNNSFLKSSGGDISDMVKVYKENERKRERDLPFVTISGNFVSVVTAGECKFRYGISQQVKVNKRELTPDEKAASVKCEEKEKSSDS